MQYTEETLRSLGDKDVVHYYEVALLEQYWGRGQEDQILLLEGELTRRGMSTTEIKTPLLERAPKLDEALDSLLKR